MRKYTHSQKHLARIDWAHWPVAANVCACVCRLSVCITFINFDDSRTSHCIAAAVAAAATARANNLTVNHF